MRKAAAWEVAGVTGVLGKGTTCIALDVWWLSAEKKQTIFWPFFLYGLMMWRAFSYTMPTANMGSTTYSYLLEATVETDVPLLLPPLRSPSTQAATLIDYTQAAIPRYYSGIHPLSIRIISVISSNHISKGMVITKTGILKDIRFF